MKLETEPASSSESAGAVEGLEPEHQRGIGRRVPWWRAARLRSALRLAFWCGMSLGLGRWLDPARSLEGAAVIAATAGVFGLGPRSAVGLASLVLFWAAFPPLHWPVSLFCLTPLMALWRNPTRLRLWFFEAVALGFACCWFAAPFLRGLFSSFGGVLLAVFGVGLGLQFAGIAWAIRATRLQPALVAGAAAAAIAVAGEAIRLYALGWPSLTLASPVVDTPLAQWAQYLGLLGVSALLYLVNFWWWPDWNRTADWNRWTTPATALLLLAASWAGGLVIQRRVPDRSLPLSAVLVQPHEVVLSHSRETTLSVNRLHLMTCGLGSRLADHDLVVWPETAVAGSTYDLEGREHSGTLGDVYRRCIPVYGTDCLVGVVLYKGRDRECTNSACLITQGGGLLRHDKLELIPLSERMPSWLDDDWSWNYLVPLTGVQPYMVPGREYRPLPFRTKDGRVLRLGVALCYESHLPWLSHYSLTGRADVIFHLMNGSWFAPFEGEAQQALWAVQYRAIETRTWQVICSAWANSGAIDPRGRVRSRLGSVPGVISVGVPTRGSAGSSSIPSSPVGGKAE